MGIEEALAVLALVGTDTPPTSAELATARDTIARTLHASKGSGDLEALLSLREAYTAADKAVAEAEEAEAAALAEEEDVLAGIPNPDAQDEDNAEGEGDQLASEAPAAHALSVAEAIARLGLSTHEREQAPAEEQATTSQTLTLNGQVKNDANWGDIGKAFATAHRRGMKTGRNSLLQIDTTFAETLPGRVDENTALLDSFTSPEAVVASGGCCSLAQPIYSNPVNGSTARPIRDALPSFGATRGSVAFYPAICLPQEGAALWTCEDDLAVDDSDETTWKQCATVDCAEEERANVEAIYACLTIGNYQQKFSAEQWQGALKALSIQQARLAEVALFDKMRDATTAAVSVADTGSVYTTFLNMIGRAATAIRQDQRLDSVQLDLFLPTWIRAAIRADLRARRLNYVDSPEVADALINTALGNENVRAVWSNDIDSLVPNGITSGELPNFLDTAHMVLAPNGYFTFLDGGTLDLGTEIRDGDNIRKNQVSAFSESFEGLLARGCNALSIDLPVTVCEEAFCFPAGDGSDNPTDPGAGDGSDD